MLQGSCSGSLRGPGALRCGRFLCRTHQGELEHEGWAQHGLHASLSPPSPALTQPSRSWQHIPVIPGTERGSSPTPTPWPNASGVIAFSLKERGSWCSSAYSIAPSLPDLAAELWDLWWGFPGVRDLPGGCLRGWSTFGKIN